MRALIRNLTVSCVIASGLLLAGIVAPGRASAHEERDLLHGKYGAEVGWLNEPAYAGQLNALYLEVVSKTEKSDDGAGKPVEGLEQTLKAQVISNGKTLDLKLQPIFGSPGHYAGYMQPTKAGVYAFRIYGTINGEQLDEKFESGPGRFSDIESLAPLQFPDKVAAAPTDLREQLDTAKSAADTARLIAVAGVVIGILGLALGAAAMMRRSISTGTATSRLSEGDLLARARRGWYRPRRARRGSARTAGKVP